MDLFEALRLRPTVPLVPRLAPSRATIHGYSVAKGTRIVQNKIAICEDASLFPEPARFDPSRFGRGEYGAHGATIVAFGVGPRLRAGDRPAAAPGLSPPAPRLRARLPSRAGPRSVLRPRDN